MVSHMNVNGERAFVAEALTVGRRMRMIALLVGEISDDARAMAERVCQNLTIECLSAAVGMAGGWESCGSQQKA